MDTVGMQILHIKRSVRYDPDMDMLPIWKYPGLKTYNNSCGYPKIKLKNTTNL